jgi:hypothetical protein
VGCGVWMVCRGGRGVLSVIVGRGRGGYGRESGKESGDKQSSVHGDTFSSHLQQQKTSHSVTTVYVSNSRPRVSKAIKANC